ncbi:Y-family DNA polymerase [Scleromatobacter humisilvae]|uniref:DNA polymerase Y family protein n=1 Tax=Scleromatobacter humisilvae TaxID=2897159 RepID=A0A9X2C0G8_9BURK|nr:DNA polymerase Y family protein [Scleromatobacter humisilvae]MCK9687317.1 DNA polymerase Y family protein [Scleromatobacter humisilvae]
MLWAALLLSPPRDDTPPSNDDALRGLAVWALQFTPRVAVSAEAVTLEVEASVRLFGGRRALRDRVVQESKELGVGAIAWAPTSLAAVALARAGRENGFRKPLDELLDELPMETLGAVSRHHTTLTQLGCRTLGDIRRLPRGGISRRFDKELLAELDQAYGQRPEAHVWVAIPETFKARLELMSRVDLAPAMLFGARRLLIQMCGWLAARHAGITAFVLRWMHDSMRSRDIADRGELVVRTAAPMRDVEHLCRLLAEQLAKVQLLAPAGDLELEALDVQALEERSESLIPDTVRAGESLTLVLERIAARLGPERVLRPALVEDHRLEWMQHWQPAPQPMARRRTRSASIPQPTFVFSEPLRLAVRGHRPMYQGPLHLLTGPHRVEGGWWHRVKEGDVEGTRNVVRDYWVALSDHCGVLWVFQERLANDEVAWYLQGSFA